MGRVTEILCLSSMEPANPSLKVVLIAMQHPLVNARAIDIGYVSGLASDSPDYWTQRALIQLQIMLILCVYHNCILDATRTQGPAFYFLNAFLMRNAEAAMKDVDSLLAQLQALSSKRKLSEITQCS